MKKETVSEIAGAAMAMKQNALQFEIETSTPIIDTCGTGGDGSDTFNISTASAFVVAGAGITVAKHGNRAISSKCGSADVLLELGVNLNASKEVIIDSIQNNGIGFLFAPNMHPAMKYVMPVRKELSTRTIFNILGPLANPVKLSGQVIGVFDQALTAPIAETLGELGTKKALVVHGKGGYDEIICHDTTQISELNPDGTATTYQFEPKEFFSQSYDLKDFAGGTTKDNAQIIRDILSGKLTGAKKDIVVLNAAAGIIVGEKANNFAEAIKLAKKSIEGGYALNKLNKLIEATN
jgi:anthranilate phosphoribosyltransferase